MSIEVRQQLLQWRAVIWRWWWLMLAITVLAGVSSYFVTKHIKPTYAATTTLFLNTASVTTAGSYSDAAYSTMLSEAYANMIDSHRVASAVIRGTHIPLTADALFREIHATSDVNTPTITIQVRDGSPMRAAQLADAVAAAFIQLNDEDQGIRYNSARTALDQQIASVQQRINTANARLSNVAAGHGVGTVVAAEMTSLTSQINSLQSTLNNLNTQLNNLLFNQSQSETTLTVTEHAQIPTGPVSPNLRLNVLLAVLAGLSLGVIIVMFLQYLDDSIKSPEMLEERLKSPVIGNVPLFTPSSSSVLVAATSQNHDAEAFKILRTNIHFSNVDRPPRSLLITSPMQGDGKSTVAANYAVAVAQTGQRVILVDADLRRPTLQKIFSLGSGPGLTDYLRDPSLGHSVVRASSTDNLRLVTSGSIPPNPSELLGAHRMAEFMDLVGANADVVIIDSPPLLAVTDALVLTNRVDGTILVIDQSKTPLRVVARALQNLHRVNAHVLGFVVNRVDARRSGYGYSYYESGYYKYQANGHIPVEVDAAPVPTTSRESR